MRWFLLLATTIVVDYFAGLWIERSEGKRRKMWLILSLITNIGFLAFFKYFNFLNTNLGSLVEFIGWNYSVQALNIILPVGLSFHTFQAMSYTIEVYRKNQKAEKHFGIYALYVMFYPQLVAGPIERPQNLIHQFYEKHSFDLTRITDGLRLMLWGFFKKLVIADNLATVVNAVYGYPENQTGISFLLATYFFAIQIYCDFSGYSDIAIGAARVMGFRLMLNFNLPYLSSTVGEFWKRWHISLSTWFRDYLYIPLGGNRVSKSRLYFNLFLTFLISGLWHGADWTFVIWGALNGFYLMAEMATGLNRRESKNWIVKAFRIAVTFHLILFSWIFFRASDVSTAFYIIETIVRYVPGNIKGMLEGVSYFHGTGGLESLAIAKFIILAAAFFIIDFLRKDPRLADWFNRRSWVRLTIYFFLFYSIVFFGYYGETQFIYFQF
jgi:D-alanyl-lipoteichoic acid acyltransferase DltB (MBOAT superfamily)